MTQHRHTTTQSTGSKIEVFCGWDRMLQVYFMDVLIPSEDPKKEDEYLYCSMEDINAMRISEWQFFYNKLIEMEIEIPTPMHEAVLADSVLQKGNEFTRWE